RALDSVQAAHVQVEAIHPHEGTGGDTEPVRPHPGPLGEHADHGPFGVAAGPAGTGLDLGLVDQVELEHDHEVREVAETRHDIGTEPRVVETDHGLHPTPVVVDGVGATAHHDAHGLQRDHGSQS